LNCLSEGIGNAQNAVTVGDPNRHMACDDAVILVKLEYDAVSRLASAKDNARQTTFV